MFDVRPRPCRVRSVVRAALLWVLAEHRDDTMTEGVHDQLPPPAARHCANTTIVGRRNSDRTCAGVVAPVLLEDEQLPIMFRLAAASAEYLRAIVQARQPATAKA